MSDSRTVRGSSLASLLSVGKRLSRRSSQSSSVSNPLYCSRDPNEQGEPTSDGESHNTSSKGDKRDKLPLHGIRLKVLQHIRDQLPQHQPWSSKQVFQKLWTLTEDPQFSFAQTLLQYHHNNVHPFAGGSSQDVAEVADAFVSHAWSILFVELVASLELYVEFQQEDPDTISFWLAGFCINQDSEHDINNWWNIIQSIPCLIVVVDQWRNPASLSRLWCLWELTAAIVSEREVSIAMPKEQANELRSTLPNDMELLMKVWLSINVENSKAQNKDCEKLIHKHIETNIQDGIVGMNKLILSLLRQYALHVCNEEFEKANDEDETSDRTLRLMSALATVLWKQGQVVKAEEYVRKVLQIREQQEAPSHSEVASSCASLGMYLFDRSRFLEAEAMLRRALNIHLEDLDGKDIAAVANYSHDLGAILNVLTKFNESETLIKRGLEIREQLYGLNHLSVAESLIELSSLYNETGRYNDYEVVINRAIDICENTDNCYHPVCAKCFFMLGQSLRYNGMLDDRSASWLQRSQAIYSVLFEDDHPRVAECLHEVSIFTLHPSSSDSDDCDASIEIVMKSYNTLLDKFGELNHHVSACCGSLALLFVLRENFTVAVMWSTKAHNINQELFPPKHPALALGCDILACALSLGNELTQPERLYRQSIRIYRHYHPDSNPALARAYNNLAMLLDKTNKPQDAIKYYKRSIRIYTKRYGEKHSWVAVTVWNLSTMYHQTKNIKRELKCVFKVLDIYKAINMEDQVDMYDELIRVSRLLHKLNRFNEAQGYLYLALQKAKQLEELGSRIVGDCHLFLAYILEKQDKVEEAQLQLQEAKTLFIPALLVDPESGVRSSLLSSFDVLGKLFIKLGNWERAEQELCQATRYIICLTGRLSPQERKIHMRLSIALEAQFKLIDAEKHARIACGDGILDHNVSESLRVEVRYQYISVLLKLGKVAQAEKLYRLGLKHLQQNPLNLESKRNKKACAKFALMGQHFNQISMKTKFNECAYDD